MEQKIHYYIWKVKPRSNLALKNLEIDSKKFQREKLLGLILCLKRVIRVALSFIGYSVHLSHPRRAIAILYIERYAISDRRAFSHKTLVSERPGDKSFVSQFLGNNYHFELVPQYQVPRYSDQILSLRALFVTVSHRTGYDITKLLYV